MIDQLIQIVDCLTEDELSTCLNLLEEKHWSPSTVFAGDKLIVDPSIRKNDRVCLSEEDELTSILHPAINNALVRYADQVRSVHQRFYTYPVPSTPNTSCFREALQVLKYEKEEYYNWHCDSASDRSVSAYHRTMSVVLYLKNADEGGRTIFPHHAYQPNPGQALIFPSNWCFPHRGEEVYSGTKIVVVTWYQSTP